MRSGSDRMLILPAIVQDIFNKSDNGKLGLFLKYELSGTVFIRLKVLGTIRFYPYGHHL